MANVNVTIRVDEQLKNEADVLFSDFGLTFNAAMNMFIKQAVREQRIPFEITKNVPIVMASEQSLNDISKKLMQRNSEAYQELAK